MKNVFQSLKDRRERSVVPVNIGRKLKHGIFIGILIAATVMMLVSKYQKADEEAVATEDPIESYDNVVEIVIADDGEVAETDESAPSEE